MSYTRKADTEKKVKEIKKYCERGFGVTAIARHLQQIYGKTTSLQSEISRINTLMKNHNIKRPKIK